MCNRLGEVLAPSLGRACLVLPPCRTRRIGWSHDLFAVVKIRIKMHKDRNKHFDTLTSSKKTALRLSDDI